MINEKRLLDEFLELVQTDSETHHEGNIAKLLKSKLEALGLTAEIDDAGLSCDSDGGNVFARFPGTLESEPIMLSAHMDTVAPGRGVKPQIRDGAIYTDGTTILGGDDKGGIAAILEAIRTVKENDLPHRTVEIIFSISEEIGLAGAKAFDCSKLTAKRAYIFDNGGATGSCTTRAAARTQISAEVIGRRAHAGSAPDKGISAIQVAAKAIANMNLLKVDEDTTCNIGSIKSEFPNNVVPDSCVLSAEVRCFTQEGMDKQVEHVRKCLQDECDAFGAELKFEVTPAYAPYAIAEDSGVFREFVAAVESLGCEVKTKSGKGGTDANIYNFRGIEALPVGIGMAKIHTTDEYIKIENLNGSARLALALMTR